MRRPARIAMVAGLLCAPCASYAAEHDAKAFVPLDEIVREAAPLSTIALHCAGLFHSVWDFAGEATLGTEASEQAKSNAALFLEAGTQLRMDETGGAQADVSQAAVAEAFRISTLYYKRYERNVSADRDAYASDEVWNSDIEICRNLAAQL